MCTAAYGAREILRSIRDSLPQDVWEAVNDNWMKLDKLLAKIASDLGKPDGFTVIEVGDVDRVLAPLPVRRLPGSGPHSAAI